MNGFVNYYKPRGMTSASAVLKLRKMLPRGVKVGHAGTLDPDAQGVLPLMVGKATRLFDYIVDKEKVYRCRFRPGAETDTQDDSGEVLRESDMRPDRADVERVLPDFIGDIRQIPPVYSALKVGGQPMYKLARQGKAVAKPARVVHVENIEILEQTGDDFMLRVACGKGTYIRTLCHDIGNALGCYGHMADLVRERAGVFDRDTATDLSEGIELLPMDAPLLHLPGIRADAKYARRIFAGNLQSAWLGAPPDGLYRLYMGDMFCGLARVEGETARFAANVMV